MIPRFDFLSVHFLYVGLPEVWINWESYAVTQIKK